MIVTAPLVRDFVTGINFTVMLTSSRSRPGQKSIGSLMVTIFEVNDFPPNVTDMEIMAPEELPVGTSIISVEAEDPEGGQISNYFVEQGSEYFSVNNKTGEIKVAGRLDYEESPVYNVTVVAVDSGVPQLSSTATIMVSLAPVNDNNPRFELVSLLQAMY
jgi:protocadherin Fat 4